MIRPIVALKPQPAKNVDNYVHGFTNANEKLVFSRDSGPHDPSAQTIFITIDAPAAIRGPWYGACA